MWYNEDGYNLAVVGATLPQGGKRLGAGRKPKLTTQLARAEKLADQLQSLTRGGLTKLAERFPELMEKSIEAALAGDAAERRFLIKTLLEMVQLEPEQTSPMMRLAQHWTIKGNVIVNKGDNKSGPNLAGDSQGPILDAEYTVIP